MKSQASRASARFILIIASLISIAPLTIDMYLPAFPELGIEFSANAGQVQLTLGLFFYGLAGGQLIYGPLSDVYGRRVPLLAGLGVFVAASMGCILAPTIEVFTAMRGLQAVGVGACVVIARAIVRDFHQGAEAARVYSVQMAVTSIAPMVAPIIGSYLLFFGWQAVFVALSLFAIACLLAVEMFLPPLRGGAGTHFRPATLITAYGPLIRDRSFLANACTGGASMSAMYAFIGASPFVFMVEFGVSEAEFAWLFALVALGLTSASAMNTRLCARYALSRIATMAAIAQALAAMFLIAASILFPHALWLAVPLALCSITPISFVTPNTTTLALEEHWRRVGSASAMLGAIQFIFAAVVNTAIGFLDIVELKPLAAVILICTLLALGFRWQALRVRSENNR